MSKVRYPEQFKIEAVKQATEECFSVVVLSGSREAIVFNVSGVDGNYLYRL